MNLLPLCPLRHRAAVFAAAFGLGVLAAPVAQAFTLDGQANTNADGSARYTDPDEQFSGFGSSNAGSAMFKQGNTTLQFGAPRSFDQRYDTNRMFQPLGRPGESDNH